MASTSNTFGGGGALSISIKGRSNISAGVNFSNNITDNNFRLFDINGDALPDMLNDGEVAFNTGTGFTGFVALDDPIMMRSKSTSTAVHGNLAYCITIPVVVGVVLVTPSISSAISQGVSRTLRQIMDINGDGYPDIIESDRNNKLYVRLNKTGRTNLLKTVNRPFGATFNLDYKGIGNTYKMPNHKMVLSRVDVHTDMSENGATRMTNTFEYEAGYHSRYEREFFGFARVITNNHDTQDDDKIYRTVVRSFNNTEFVEKNLLQSNVLKNGNGINLVSTTHQYELLPQSHDTGSVFPALVKTITQKRELNEDSEIMHTYESFEYDNMGNVVVYASNVSGSEVRSYIGYHSLEEHHRYDVPSIIRVTTTDGIELRRRETDVDQLGNITQIRMYNNDNVAHYDMTYDRFGNLIRITRPENHKGQRMWFEYTYDDVLHMLVTSVIDAFGYTSSTVYDYRWAVPLETTDINGNRMVYTYDGLGRLKTVTAPYELEAGHPYTISFEYVADAQVPYARTSHFDGHTGGRIATYTFVDALLRPVQVKRRGTVFIDGADRQVMLVSGRVRYDAFGRAVEQFHPVVEPLANAAIYSTVTDNVPPTLMQYDVLDRIIRVTLPDGASTTTQYAMVTRDGETMVQTITADALGRRAVAYTDGRGRTRSTLRMIDDQPVRVSYRYNLVGDLLEVTHPNGHITTYTYDKLGRQLSVDHPDAGLITFEYDNANNLVRKQTPNLRTSHKRGGWNNRDS